MNKLIIFILTLLPVLSYSQVTSINIDTSASQVIIINGTMIQNNGGTVNTDSNESSEDQSAVGVILLAVSLALSFFAIKFIIHGTKYDDNPVLVAGIIIALIALAAFKGFINTL